MDIRRGRRGPGCCRRSWPLPARCAGPGLGGEDVDAFVEVPVCGGRADVVVAAQLGQAGVVREPAQHEHGRLAHAQRPPAGAGAHRVPVLVQQPARYAMLSRGTSRMAEYEVTRGSRWCRRSSARQSCQEASCCCGRFAAGHDAMTVTHCYGPLLGIAQRQGWCGAWRPDRRPAPSEAGDGGQARLMWRQ
jgi:hypothetical protein